MADYSVDWTGLWLVEQKELKKAGHSAQTLAVMKAHWSADSLDYSRVARLAHSWVILMADEWELRWAASSATQMADKTDYPWVDQTAGCWAER